MKFWIAGTIEECATAASTGLISAVVTNPTVIADWCADGKSLEQACDECLQAIKLPLFVQLPDASSDVLIRQVLELKDRDPRLMPKLPCTAKALTATRVLTDRGIDCLLTCVCSLEQAVLCSVAGAKWVCPYFARVNQYGEDAELLITQIQHALRPKGHDTLIFPASIRSRADAAACIRGGADGLIIFAKLFRQMFEHPVTEQSLTAFSTNDWPRIRHNFKAGKTASESSIQP